MTTKEKIRSALIALGILGMLFLVWTIIRGQQKYSEEMFRSVVASQDREIKAVQGQRDILLQWNAEKDRIISEHQRIDSMLAQKQVQTIIKYEKIPATVRNLSHEELRGAVIDFE